MAFLIIFELGLLQRISFATAVFYFLIDKKVWLTQQTSFETQDFFSNTLWAQNISPKTADQPLTIMEKIIEFFMIMIRLVSPFLKSIEDSVYYIK